MLNNQSFLNEDCIKLGLQFCSKFCHFNSNCMLIILLLVKIVPISSIAMYYSLPLHHTLCYNAWTTHELATLRDCWKLSFTSLCWTVVWTSEVMGLAIFIVRGKDYGLKAKPFMKHCLTIGIWRGREGVGLSFCSRGLHAYVVHAFALF